MFLGNETDGVQAGVPIPGTHLTGSAFFLSQETGDYDVPNWYGVGTWGNIGHNVVEVIVGYGFAADHDHEG